MSKLMLLLSAIAIALPFGVAVSTAEAAYNGGAVYDSGSQCVRNESWMLSGGWNGVNTLSLTDTPWFRFPTAQCGYNNPKPNGYLAAAWDYSRWNGYGWIFCGNQDWVFGGGSQLNMGRNTSGCGAGYYWMWGGSFVKNGDNWLGGWVGVGYEWLTF